LVPAWHSWVATDCWSWRSRSRSAISWNAPLYPVVLPVYALQTTGSASTLGFLLAGVGLGALAEAVAFGVVGRRLPRRALWLIGHLAFPFAYWALVLRLPVPATFSLLAGSINPLLVTVRHERIPPELRERVFSTFSAIASVAQPLGAALGGAAIDRLGFDAAVGGLGVCLALLALALPPLPVLRDLDKPSAAAFTSEAGPA
jgi:predicted MFS family arabinose efflux permease